jgi:hypothetical protein
MVHSYISPKELSNAVSKVPLHPHNLLPATPKAADSHRGVETCPTYAQRTAHHSLGKAQWSCQQSSVPTTHTTTPCPARRRESHTQDASCILRLGIASPLQLRSVALDTQTCASNGDSEIRNALPSNGLEEHRIHCTTGGISGVAVARRTRLVDRAHCSLNVFLPWSDSEVRILRPGCVLRLRHAHVQGAFLESSQLQLNMDQQKNCIQNCAFQTNQGKGCPAR